VCADNGHVLKVLNAGRLDSRMEPLVIEDIPVFPSAAPVIGLRIYTRYHGDRSSARLLVVSGDELRSLPLHRCSRKTTCWY